MLQARRDSNPQPPVLETGALPVELRTSCIPRLFLALPAGFGGHHGQGRNRTADTMIFSHVLYQLSYLAQTKNPPEPGRHGREDREEGRSTGSPLPPAFAGSTCRNPSRTPNSASVSPQTLPNMGSAALRRRFTSNSGGRIRTCDLRVMSPTIYQTAPPRNRRVKLVTLPR